MGGALLFSGFYLGSHFIRPCIANEDLPVFVFHGSNDDTIDCEEAKYSYESFPKRGREFTMYVAPGLGHTIGEEGLLLMRKYFDKFVGRKPLEGLWFIISYNLCLLLLIIINKLLNYKIILNIN